MRIAGKKAGISVTTSESYASAVFSLLSLRNEIHTKDIIPHGDAELVIRDRQLALDTRLRRGLEVGLGVPHRRSIFDALVVAKKMGTPQENGFQVLRSTAH